ncbi:5-methylcytosine-specific restriction enzyme A [Clostridium neonatale]|uniref:HNH endonuclease n=1 Tax=Clostridium neonatale TaxID=137838 RepID=UPI00291C1CBF|nr:hypothetical protein [Clostridium neonatale]CAI3673487.1 5-methylcytosine-specific restriction enzyme A [Clostridium neonatale]
MIADFFKYLYYKHTDNRINYTKYLMSKHWKKTRAKAVKRADYKCQLCGTRKDTLNVHHNSYENLYHEKKSDLIVLCRRCHARHHNKPISNRKNYYKYYNEKSNN